MAQELWDISRVALELGHQGGHGGPIELDSARKDMSRAGITVTRCQCPHGYPADEVRAYAAGRRGRGYRSDLKPTTGAPHREES